LEKLNTDENHGFRAIDWNRERGERKKATQRERKTGTEEQKGVKREPRNTAVKTTNKDNASKNERKGGTEK
jgi:hypothetical protein